MTPTGSALPPKRPILLLILVLCWAPTAEAEIGPHQAKVPVHEIQLENGMTLLLVNQPESTTVAAGWMVGVGSADDPAERSGLSHLLEHMMFKGTDTVGTRNAPQEAQILDQIDELWARRLQALTRTEAATTSVKKKEKAVRQVEDLTREIESLERQAEKLAYLGEFSFLYSEQGGIGLDANTLQDSTLYFVTLPADKLELWFWLESNRLLNPVFRQFYTEVQVVHEERRLRIESTPTGLLDERLRALFWGDSAYSWHPMGHADHIDKVSRSDATHFFRTHYRPDNLTAALVGAFDVEQVAAWAQLYFGRLQRPPKPDTTVAPSIVTSTGEKRFEEVCNCPPQVQILYSSPRFGDDDNYALQLLSAIMNGRTGRLFRDLVLDRQLAFSAYTQQVPWKRAGVFTFRAESKGSTDPEALIAAWDENLNRLLAEPPSEEETNRARNRVTADAFRSLKEPLGLMRQLLIYEGLGDWNYLNQWSGRIQQVAPAEVQAAVAKYLVPQRRTIAIYRRPGTRPSDQASPEAGGVP